MCSMMINLQGMFCSWIQTSSPRFPDTDSVTMSLSAGCRFKKTKLAFLQNFACCLAKENRAAEEIQPEASEHFCCRRCGQQLPSTQSMVSFQCRFLYRLSKCVIKTAPLDKHVSFTVSKSKTLLDLEPRTKPALLPKTIFVGGSGSVGRGVIQ